MFGSSRATKQKLPQKYATPSSAKMGRNQDIDNSKSEINMPVIASPHDASSNRQTMPAMAHSSLGFSVPPSLEKRRDTAEAARLQALRLQMDQEYAAQELVGFLVPSTDLIAPANSSLALPLKPIKIKRKRQSGSLEAARETDFSFERK